MPIYKMALHIACAIARTSESFNCECLRQSPLSNNMALYMVKRDQSSKSSANITGMAPPFMCTYLPPASKLHTSPTMTRNGRVSLCSLV